GRRVADRLDTLDPRVREDRAVELRRLLRLFVEPEVGRDRLRESGHRLLSGVKVVRGARPPGFEECVARGGAKSTTIPAQGGIRTTRQGRRGSPDPATGENTVT